MLEADCVICDLGDCFHAWVRSNSVLKELVICIFINAVFEVLGLHFTVKHNCGRPSTSWVHYTTSCNTQSSAPEDGQNNCPKHVELIGIINKPLLLHLVGSLYYLYQWCTVKQTSHFQRATFTCFMYLLYFTKLSQIRFSGLELCNILCSCKGCGMKWLWVKFGLG